MANAFLEVFPTLQLNHEMKGLLSEATVTKVASNRNRDFIRVYFDKADPEKRYLAVRRGYETAAFSKPEDADQADGTLPPFRPVYGKDTFRYL